jgi:hypothetical protein
MPMQSAISLSTDWEESLALLRKARSYFHSTTADPDFRKSLEFSIAALVCLACALHKANEHLSANRDRQYSNKHWSVLDQFFVEAFDGTNPKSLAKVRRLLDLVTVHTGQPWDSDKRIVARADAAIVLEATTSILTIGAKIVGLDSSTVENAS